MPTALAALLGFLFVVAYAPGWGQPAVEPKSLVLFLAGGLAWLWMARKRMELRLHPWALLLPALWLALSAAWSVAPQFGAQRLLWLIAALGLGGLLAERKGFDRFMGGFLLGSAVHAILIALQWIPQFRPLLPHGLASDAFQGIGRGLFHNTNMAVQPLVMAVSWLLLSEREEGKWLPFNLVWLLPAIALTQSRFGTAVCCALLAYVATRALKEKLAPLPARLLSIACLACAIGWAALAHRWGWVIPLAGGLLGAFQGAETLSRPRTMRLRWALLAGLVVSLGVGWQVYSIKNQPVVAGSSTGAAVVAGDASLKQRQSYYRAGLLAFLDRPLVGQGLGSARALYPYYVDLNHPAIEIAYGDFQRPNNLHSDYLELLMEGGLGLLLLLGVGLWLDRKQTPRRTRVVLLLPLAALGLLDFPFHNPLGLLWAGLCLALTCRLEAPLPPRWTRAVQVLVGLGLLGLGGLQYFAASRQSAVVQAYLGGRDADSTFHKAAALWRTYPFSADVFDLYSKSALQAAGSGGNVHVNDLVEILKLDPWDHHLLLGCAQAARREGDGRLAQSCLDRYARVAPRDPDRFIRLAKGALAQGKGSHAGLLFQEAAKQPGFGPGHQKRIEALLAPAAGSSRAR